MNSNDAFRVALSVVNIINCTITNQGNDSLRISSSTMNIINSIIWNNTSREFFLDYKNNITIAFSDIKGGKDNIKADDDSLFYDITNISKNPLFKNISTGDYVLSKDSPCIDYGTAFYQIGDSVIVNIPREDYKGDAPDMGAFESDYYSTIVNDNNPICLSLFNFPNPFNSSTTINFSLSHPGHVRLVIYTITGQKVINLLEKYLHIGNYQIQWIGVDESGIKISSGVYIIRLIVGDCFLSKRIVYMK